MTIGVYIAKVPHSFECYVGSSIRCEGRIERHLYSLERGTHYNHLVQEAYDKHGLEFYIVWSMSATRHRRKPWLLWETEEDFMEDLPGRRLNLTSYALGPSRDPRVGRKISEAMRGVPKSPDHIRALREAHRGRTEWTARQRKAWIARRDDPLTPAQLAYFERVREACRIRHANKPPRPSRRESYSKIAALSPTQVERIRVLYKRGNTMRAIANSFCVSLGVVHKVVHARGLVYGEAA